MRTHTRYQHRKKGREQGPGQRLNPGAPQRPQPVGGSGELGTPRDEGRCGLANQALPVKGKPVFPMHL